MRLSARLLASALLCTASAVAAHADSITTFSVTGRDGAFSFSLPSSPTPSSTKNNATGFTLSNATFNGTPVSGDTVYFYTSSGAGGLYLTNSSGSYELNEFGPQIFSGTIAAPVFSTGTFTFSSGSANLNGVAQSDQGDVLTVSTGVSPVPEPATFTLIGTGVLGLIGLGRRALART